MTADQLIAEADRLITMIAAKRLPRPDELLAARDKVYALPVDQRVPANPEIVALKREIEITRQSVSHRVVYACILLSIVLMFLVGSLSVVYNKGVALLSEIETLAARQPDRRFGQLERQLLVAQSELFNDKMADAAKPCEPGLTPCEAIKEPKSTIDELAQESSYLTLHELRDLNFTLKSLETRLGEFENLSGSPFPGMLRAQAMAGSLISKGRTLIDVSGAANADATKPVAVDVLGNSPPPDRPGGNDTMNFFCLPTTATKPTENGPGGATSREADSIEFRVSAGNSQVLGMDMRKIFDQACKYSLSYVSMSVPSVNVWALRVKDSIDPYALWILPCLYAALGSMIYYMRLILDPTQSNPPVFRIAHRMALAALAGMIMAWFWEPTFGKNAEFKSVGFGLFTFAFIVGFSIDVFFALLDRLVFVSTNAINKLGTT